MQYIIIIIIILFKSGNIIWRRCKKNKEKYLQIILMTETVVTVVWYDQSTVHLDWQLGGYTGSARVRNVWGINRVLLRIFIWFFIAGFHVANLAVTRCYYCADVWSVLAYFYIKHNRAPQSTGRSGQIINSVCMSQFSWRAWPMGCSRSTVAVAAPARLGLCRTLCTGA